MKPKTVREKRADKALRRCPCGAEVICHQLTAEPEESSLRDGWEISCTNFDPDVCTYQVWAKTREEVVRCWNSPGRMPRRVKSKPSKRGRASQRAGAGA